MRAPGAPGAAAGWGPGRKQAFGAAPGPRSRVWFTVAQGNLSEVFYPTLGQPLLAGLDFFVAASGAPPINDASEATHEVSWTTPGLPVFSVLSRHTEYSLTKEFIVDPESNALLLAVAFRPDMPDLRLYLQASLHGLGDGYVLPGEPPSLFACQGGRWLVLLGPFTRCSAGYLRSSDLLVDLHDNDGVMTAEYHRAPDGHVGLGAEVGFRSGSFQLALGFGSDPKAAEEAARGALERGAGRVREQLAAAWRALPDLDRNVLRVAGDGGDLARCSLTLLRCLEDKERPGAFVAAPAAAWGRAEQTYSLVWNRDLCHIAAALLDVGEVEAARRALRYLEETQLDDGGWPRARTLDGRPRLGGRELDQVALPILLAWRLGVAGELDHDPWPGLVRRAAAHLVRHGPATEFDRWGDAGGLSPSTLAAMVAALVVAAEFAQEAEEPEAAAHLLAVADYWNDSLESWTYLTDFRHYVRVSADPDQGPRLEDDVICLEFLELVRRGLRRPDEPRIRTSLTTADVLLQASLPEGPGWRRYAGDGYGEGPNGSPWTAEGSGKGRVWPLLSGERAFHQLALGTPPIDHVRALEAWAGPERILPQQVWDEDDLPELGLYRGRATGAVAPLGWAHAEYLSLLAAIAWGRLPDLVEPARRRYLEAPPVDPPPVWSHSHRLRTFPVGRRLKVQLPRPGTVRWKAEGWAGWEAAAARDCRLGCWVAELPVQGVAVGGEVRWTVAYADGSEEGAIHTLRAVARPR